MRGRADRRRPARPRRCGDAPGRRPDDAARLDPQHRQRSRQPGCAAEANQHRSRRARSRAAATPSRPRRRTTRTTRRPRSPAAAATAAQPERGVPLTNERRWLPWTRWWSRSLPTTMTAQDAAALVQRFRLVSLDLVNFQLGGTTAMRLPRAFPTAVRSLGRARPRPTPPCCSPSRTICLHWPMKPSPRPPEPKVTPAGARQDGPQAHAHAR